jgi:hypothetical protein
MAAATWFNEAAVSKASNDALDTEAADECETVPSAGGVGPRSTGGVGPWCTGVLAEALALDPEAADECETVPSTGGGLHVLTGTNAGGGVKCACVGSNG